MQVAKTKIVHSYASGYIPNTLEYKRIFINLADAKMYIGDENNYPVTLTSLVDLNLTDVDVARGGNY